MVTPERRVAILRWFIIWTTIGCIFSLQLRWHYKLPWSLSVFWGLADWYLWGVLALTVFVGIRLLKRLKWNPRRRLLLYALAAPAVAGVHVVLTMIVGGDGDIAARIGWFGYFGALYAKKLTLNVLTFSALILVGERLTAKATIPSQAPTFPARFGETTRFVSPEEVFWGEVGGNYVNLHTRDGVWPVRITLNQILQRLPKRQFVQVSRSGLINLGKVRAMQSDSGSLSVILVDGSSVPVARRHHSKVRQALRDHCGLENSDR